MCLTRFLFCVYSILLTTHNQPDPDALSSLSILNIAVKKYLKKEKVESIIYITTQASKFPWKILETAKVLKMGEVTDLSKFDLIIMIDAQEVGRCIPDYTNLNENTVLVSIEHHELIPEAVAKLTLNFNEFRSSAAEEAYRIFSDMFGDSFRTDEEVVLLAQMGIVSDTGRFLYPNTKPETHQLMSDLISIKRLDMEEYTNKLSMISVAAMRAMEVLMQSFTPQDGWGYMVITNEDVKRLGISEFDKEEASIIIVNTLLRTIEGVGWGFVLSQFEGEPEKWKLSLRANNGTREVVHIAKVLGGGGHKYAAGAFITAGSKEEAIEKVLEAVKKTS
jgi:phosphoesterase RecJ-like protein